MEALTDYIFLSSQITVDIDFSHEVKICLLLRRKAMPNLDSILKSRDITFPTKVFIVKAMVFPVVMYGCPSLVAQMAKNLPAVQETQVRSLGWEDSLEKGMATHSHILAWRIPWRSGGLYSHGLQEAEITIFPCNC